MTTRITTRFALCEFNCCNLSVTFIKTLFDIHKVFVLAFLLSIFLSKHRILRIISLNTGRAAVF